MLFGGGWLRRDVPLSTVWLNPTTWTRLTKPPVRPRKATRLSPFCVWVDEQTPQLLNEAHRQELALRPTWLRSKNAAGMYRLISQTYNRNIHLVFASQPGSGHNDQQGRRKRGMGKARGEMDKS